MSIKLQKNNLSDAEVRKLAEDLTKEILEAGGLEKYYDKAYGAGAYYRDVLAFIPASETRH